MTSTDRPDDVLAGEFALGLLEGRELETFTSGFDSVATGSRQFSFTGQHWLTPSWALSYDVLSNDPSSLRLQGLRESLGPNGRVTAVCAGHNSREVGSAAASFLLERGERPRAVSDLPPDQEEEEDGK